MLGAQPEFCSADSGVTEPQQCLSTTLLKTSKSIVFTTITTTNISVLPSHLWCLDVNIDVPPPFICKDEQQLQDTWTWLPPHQIYLSIPSNFLAQSNLKSFTSSKYYIQAYFKRNIKLCIIAFTTKTHHITNSFQPEVLVSTITTNPPSPIAPLFYKCTSITPPPSS